MGDLNLVQVWHIHQPATQTAEWVARAVYRAYRPLLRIHSQFPAVRWNLNITGSLLDQIHDAHGDIVRLAAEATASGTLEPTTTGYYQPIIPFIPKEHAVVQIRKNTLRVEELIGYRPRAAWVPERAWESWMAEVFQAAEVSAVLLDDHLLQAPRPAGWKYRPREAVHDSSRVAVYLIDEEMRYHIPWRPVDEVMRRLEEIADATDGTAVVTFADDGEKMGLWPGTENIHPWLEEFLGEVEERSWIRTTTLEEYLNRFGTAGKGEFISGSYREMEEWCLGDLRNWLRHPTVRDMYARLRLAIREIGKGPIPDAILKAEVNDPYWYARRMTYHRQEVYRNILEAESALVWRTGAHRGDLNGDGEPEVLIEDEQQRIFLDAHGRVYEWDHRRSGHNFVNTGFLDLEYGEDKPLVDEGVFNMPRRNCLTEFIDGRWLRPAGLRLAHGVATVKATVGEMEVTKALSLVDGVLRCHYCLRSLGGPWEGRMAVEVCFTPPTDTVEASIRDYHRHVFDYAGTVVDRPVESAKDGPGVAWCSVVDRAHGVVAGAAWRPGTIEAHERGIIAEAAASTPIFPVRVPPMGSVELDLRLAVTEGDHRHVASLLRDLL